MIIDSHQHYWQLDLPFDYQWLTEPQHAPINRNYLPADLAPHLQAAGVDYSVFVQTQHNIEETKWALSLAEENDFLVGVVGWVNLAASHCEADLVKLKEHSKFVGIRHITQDEPDDNFIIRPEILAGLKILETHAVPFDLLFFAKHLKHTPTVAAHVPDLPLVIDHLSKPSIKDQNFDEWAADIAAAARHENVFCKLSGMITEADWQHWTPDDLRRYVETTIEAFGTKRCMFGSDWPVCELAGTYQDVFDVLGKIVAGLSDDEKDDIFCQTAKKFYNLNV